MYDGMDGVNKLARSDFEFRFCIRICIYLSLLGCFFFANMICFISSISIFSSCFCFIFFAYNIHINFFFFFFIDCNKLVCVCRQVKSNRKVTSKENIQKREENHQTNHRFHPNILFAILFSRAKKKFAHFFISDMEMSD